MNVLDQVGRVLCVAGLVFVVVVFWQRERIKKFALARAGKSPALTRKHFWISIALGAVMSSLLPSFFQSCTGFHLPGTIRMLISLGMFIVFIAFLALAYFVIERHRAQHPQGSVRVGFVLISIAGILFVLALWFDHLGHR